MTATVFERLTDLVREDGGLLAKATGEHLQAPTPLGDQVATAPRATSHGADLALVVEAVHEGYLLHHGTPRVMAQDDPDLALLAGDRLYAAALERLAAAGDLESVRALADVIALCASAHSRGDEDLAAAVWEAGIAEVGWGVTEALSSAKTAALSGEDGAAQALRNAALNARAAAKTVR